jgi:hypothetical protein
MGLDAVELVINLEDAFGVAIPDAAAEQMRTVGDTYDRIVSCLRERAADMSACGSAHTFYRLRQELASHLGVARRLVRPDSVLENLIAPLARRWWPRIARAAAMHVPRHASWGRFPPAGSTIREVIRQSAKSRFIRANKTVDEHTVWDAVCEAVFDVSGADRSTIHRGTRYIEDLGY